MAAKSSAPDLGSALQDLRKAKGFTLEQLAGRSGVSKSMLSQIERGQTNPTFATLWGLTQALGVEISELIDGSQSEESASTVEHVPAHFTPTIKSQDGKCEAKILSPIGSAAKVEWYEMHLAPHGALESAPHLRGTMEHLTVFSGMLSVHTGNECHVVKAGETLRYNADCTHAIKNDTTAAAHALLVVVCV